MGQLVGALFEVMGDSIDRASGIAGAALALGGRLSGLMAIVPHRMDVCGAAILLPAPI